MRSGITVGIDIGGTFTDVVVLDAGRLRGFAKVPSTPRDLAAGVVGGVLAALDPAGVAPGEVGRVAHGTTVAMNTVLERTGAIVGLLATEGFEDTLEIGRMKRAEMYDLFIDPQTPVFLAPARRREPVPERIAADGSVLVPLDEAALRRSVRRLVEEEGVTALAVSYLHAYRNPEHERRTRAIIAEMYPGLVVSLSSDVNPQFREYERTCTTAFDAYVRPVMTSYIETLVRRLGEIGIRAPVDLMLSRGGLAHTARAASRPVALFLSGPAGGVLGASVEAALNGIRDVITLDMGGTSADVALVNDATPALRPEGTIDGYPVRTPMLDMTTVGAGGGSIAWVDGVGDLHVGPRSAGADPGPACYARAGGSPTVTDASLLLGYLNPAGFGRRGLRLDREAAERAMRPLARRLGYSVVEAAAGVHRVVNASMADRLRLVSIRRGHDPRRYILVAFGGAGPLHGPALLADLPIRGVLIPVRPGVLSAVGLTWAATEHDAHAAIHRRLDDLDAGALRATIDEQDRIGRRALAAEGIAEGVEREVWAAVRYAGQSYELDVPVDPGAASGDAIAEAFHRRHEEAYGYAHRGAPAEIVSLRVTHRRAGARPGALAAPSGSGRPAGERAACFSGLPEPARTPVYWRDDLGAGQVISGPAIVEQEDATTVIYPGQVARRLSDGALLIERRAE
jgi:N-methylhydantoinase A/oxoprolinase/acetone carboxylase beta subunit